jgi:hypothetical protein
LTENETMRMFVSTQLGEAPTENEHALASFSESGLQEGMGDDDELAT